MPPPTNTQVLDRLSNEDDFNDQVNKAVARLIVAGRAEGIPDEQLYRLVEATITAPTEPIPARRSRQTDLVPRSGPGPHGIFANGG